MSKKYLLLFILTLVLLLNSCTAKQDDGELSVSDIEFSVSDGEYLDFKLKDIDLDKEIEHIIDNVLKKKGCITDEKSAKEVADIIFKSAYDEDYPSNDLPLLAYYDDSEKVWMVQTQLPKGWVGGCLTVIIKASNAEVIAIWGTK